MGIRRFALLCACAGQTRACAHTARRAAARRRALPASVRVRARGGLTPAPHLCPDCTAQPRRIGAGTGDCSCNICTRTGPSQGRCSPLPHLHRDWVHPCHICTGTGLTPATSAPGLGFPPSCIHVRAALRPPLLSPRACLHITPARHSGLRAEARRRRSAAGGGGRRRGRAVGWDRRRRHRCDQVCRREVHAGAPRRAVLRTLAAFPEKGRIYTLL